MLTRPMTRTWLTIGVACLLCFAFVPAEVLYGGGQSSADPASYFYDLRGRQYVTASPTDFVVKVRPTAGRPASQRPSWLGPVTETTATPGTPGGPGEPVRRIDTALARRGLHVVHGTADRTVVASRQDVEWTLPILHRQGSQTPIYLTDQIVMRFNLDITEGTAAKIISAAGCQIVRHDTQRPERYVLRVPDPAKNSPLTVANALHDTPGVRYAHPDFILVRRTCNPPVIEDALYSQQWNLDGDVTKGASANADINVEGAWGVGNASVSEGDPSIRVAVIDDSIQKDHPDLISNYFTGRNFDVYAGDPSYNDPSPTGPYELHGTSVSGVAVGAGNTIGIRGVAPRCGLIGVKALESPISDIANAFYYAMDPDNDGEHSDGAAVINNSWQLTDGEFQPPDLIAAINDVAQQGRNGLGCVVLFASANSAHTVNGITVLAQLDSVICVGGSNSFATHTEYADVGPEVSVVAPTSDSPPPETRQSALQITTTDDVGSWGYNMADSPDGDYTGEFGGTSAATPTVAGVCALILSQNSGLTAIEVRQILEHTAVQIDPGYARIDGISGHSDRFGYGRVDAAAAAAAASQGIAWPGPVKNLACNVNGSTVSLSWTNPPGNYLSTLIVRANRPFAWRPTDGVSYRIGEEIAPGVSVVSNSATTEYTATNLPRNGYFFGVYPRGTQDVYGWGRECHAFVDTMEVFYDDSEGPDPGWTHGGPGDVWARAIPGAYVSPYGWDATVYQNGPMVGTRSTRAINGNQCWGTGSTDYPYTYLPNSDTWLRTPTIDLTGMDGPAFVSFYDWCLLETPYDHCTVKVVDESGGVLGTLESNYGGDFDWTPHVYDITAFTNRRIKIQFELLSDETIQRDGWFIDEVRVLTAARPNAPPVASNVSVTTARNFAVTADLNATDPEPADVLTFTITSLPAAGTLSDPGAGLISQVPYALVNNGRTLRYAPPPQYAGSTSFTYHASDRFSPSNEATVSVTVQKYAADFDQDGDVDLGDFTFLQMCYHGPNQPTFLECGPADIDDDHDVDLGDFLIFQSCFSGPNRPPAAGCPPMP